MKLSNLTKRVLISVSLATLLVSVAQADPRDARKKGNQAQNQTEERYVLLTGSRIPQKVEVKTVGTATPYNLRVYTQRDLERSGRTTTGEALRTLDPSIGSSGR